MATKPKRPTAAQTEVLRKMRDGGELRSTGLFAHLSGPIRSSTVRMATLKSLKSGGFVECWENPNYGGMSYRLSPAGRAAIGETPE